MPALELPHNFYTLVGTDQEQYQETGGEDGPDITQSIQSGKLLWKKPGEVAIQQKKTIVLSFIWHAFKKTDLNTIIENFNNPNFIDTLEKLDYVKRLLDSGFSVLLPTQNGLKELKAPISLKTFEAYQKDDLSDAKRYFTYGTTLKKNRDSLLLLDDKTCKDLKKTNTILELDPLDLIDIENIENSKFENVLTEKQEAILQNKLPPFCLIESTYPHIKIPFLESMRKNKKTGRKEISLIIINANKIDEETLRSSDLRKSGVEFKIDESRRSSVMLTIYKALRKSETPILAIDIDGSYFDHISINFINFIVNKLNLSQLKSFSLDEPCFSFDFKIPSNFFSHFSELETLKLNDYNLELDIASAIAQLPKLKKLIITDSAIKLPKKVSIAPYTSEIEELHLLEAGCLYKMILHIQFPKLRKLIIPRSNINERQLSVFLKDAYDLEELDLSECTNIDWNSVLLPSFKKLKKLTLPKNNMTEEKLSQLLGTLPNDNTTIIEELSLKQCPMIGIRSRVIKKILAAGTEIDPINTFRIAVHLEGAEELDFNHCTGIKNIIKFYSRFFNIKKIDLSYTDITVEELKKLLISSTNLKEINISNCPNLKTLPGNLELLKLLVLKLPQDDVVKILKNIIENYPESYKSYIATINALNIDRSRLPATTRNEPTTVFLPQFAQDDAETSKQLNEKIDFNQAPNLSPGQTPYHNQKERADANTHYDPEKALTKREIFYAASNADYPAPSINHYRLSCYDTLTLNSEICGQNNAFTLSNKPDALEKIVIVKSDNLYSNLHKLVEDDKGKSTHDSQFFYGIVDLKLNREWQALPASSAKEVILQYHLNLPLEVEFSFSKKKNIYYIRKGEKENKGITEVKIDFIIERKKQNGNSVLPNYIQTLQKEISDFGIDYEPSNEDPKNGEGHLQYILDKKVGACRHRAVVFISELKKIERKSNLSETPVNYIGNDIHAFIEVFFGGEWISCDLGGYPCRESLDNKNKPTLTENKSTLTENKQAELNTSIVNEDPIVAATADYKDIVETQIYRVPDETAIGLPEPQRPLSTPTPLLTPLKKKIQQLCTGENKKYLLKLEGSANIESMAYQLQCYCAVSSKRPYFYIDKPDDLICSSPIIERNGDVGELKNGPGGLLFEFLTLCKKQTDPAPALFINFGNFSTNEIIKFNTLYGDERKIDGINMPDNLTIIALIDIAQTEVIEDDAFKSRFRLDQTIDTSIYTDELTLPALFTQKTEDVTELPTAELSAYDELESAIDNLSDQDSDDAQSISDKSINENEDEDIAFEAEKTEETMETEVIISERNSPVSSVNDDNDTTDDLSTITINLYESKEWKSILLGQWFLRGKSLLFHEGQLSGVLKKAYESQKSVKNITFLNPPKDPNFERFFREALLRNEMAEIMVTDKQTNRPIPVPFPDTIKLSTAVWHNFKNLPIKSIHSGLPESKPSKIYVLNNELYSSFFHRDIFNGNDNSITRTKGWIEENTGKVVTVYINDTLSLGRFEQFFDLCRKNNVKINLYIAPTLKLPTELNYPVKEKKVETNITLLPWRLALSKTHYIESTDKEVTIRQLEKTFRNEKPIIIDISELKACDLLKKLTGNFDTDRLEFSFSEEEKFLLTALKEKKTVILCGNISLELVNNLTPYLIERKYAGNPKGRLYFISHSKNPFSDVVTSTYHKVTATEKQKLITKTISKQILKETPLSKIEASIRSNDPWVGYEKAPIIEPRRIPINLSKAMAVEKNFTRKRLNDVENLLEKHSQPYVFLGGLTGVGKTTFVIKHFNKDNRKLFRETDIKNWAMKPADKYVHYLFIDEATVTQKQWSQFRGLFYNPKTIVIDGILITLTDQHKVIFAGNPTSYSADRTVPALFQDYGNAVLFDIIPAEVIYLEILQPLFENTAYEKQKEEIALPVLEMAQFLFDRGHNTMLITPRELTTVIMFTLSYCEKNKNENPVSVAKYYAYSLLNPFVPNEYQAEFHRQYFPDFAPKIADIISPKSDFYLTDNNQPAALMLNDFLMLRAYRREHPEFSNKQLFDGLGGMVLEGDSGIGKSNLVIEVLLANDFKKGNPEEEISSDDLFYHIEARWSLKKRKITLLKAYFEGNPVIWDEINCSYSMETFLNDLLMGKIPDDEVAIQYLRTYSGYSPKPGFNIIGTQNPDFMAGRGKTSDALLHRMHYKKVPGYSETALIDVLRYTGLEKTIAEKMVSQFSEKNENDSPGSVRTLFQNAKKAVDHYFPDRIFIERKLLLTEKLILDTEKKYRETTTLLETENLMQEERIKESTTAPALDILWYIARIISFDELNALCQHKNMTDVVFDTLLMKLASINNSSEKLISLLETLSKRNGLPLEVSIKIVRNAHATPAVHNNIEKTLAASIDLAASAASLEKLIGLKSVTHINVFNNIINHPNVNTPTLIETLKKINTKLLGTSEALTEKQTALKTALLALDKLKNRKLEKQSDAIKLGALNKPEQILKLIEKYIVSRISSDTVNGYQLFRRFRFDRDLNTTKTKVSNAIILESKILTAITNNPYNATKALEEIEYALKYSKLSNIQSVGYRFSEGDYGECLNACLAVLKPEQKNSFGWKHVP